METADVANLSPYGRFCYWIQERHSIFLKKQGGWEKPWTDDEVLQRYFFTNPYRENDKVTVWVRKNIREPYRTNPNLWFMLCLARQINRPETLQGIMDKGLWPVESYFPKRVANYLDWRKENRLPVYTGAYMVRAESDPNSEWYDWTKQQYMARIVIGEVWKRRGKFITMLQERPRSMERTCKWLQQFHGWGGFGAYEVVCDLRYTHYLRNAPDRLTWANLGPGAKRGLNRIHDRDLRAPLSQKEGCREMFELLQKVQSDPGMWDLPELEMREIEHSLCEFDKYERMRLGQGQSKRVYNGTGD